MNTDAEKLLFALYAEQNAKRPHMSAAAQSIGLTGETLGRAVNALYVARLISGVSVKFGDEDETPAAVTTDNIILTRRGADNIDKALGIDAEA